ncbi:hypothetical protein VPH35_126154 [Triticum aestivum]
MHLAFYVHLEIISSQCLWSRYILMFSREVHLMLFLSVVLIAARGFGLPAKTSNTKVILNGGQKVTFARPDGYFAFHNVPAGTHLIEVSSLGYFFSPVRVDISARNPGHIQAALTENRRVLNELVLEPLKEEQYYEVSNAIVFC